MLPTSMSVTFVPGEQPLEVRFAQAKPSPYMLPTSMSVTFVPGEQPLEVIGSSKAMAIDVIAPTVAPLAGTFSATTICGAATSVDAVGVTVPAKEKVEGSAHFPAVISTLESDGTGRRVPATGKVPRKDASVSVEKNWLWKTPRGCVESAESLAISRYLAPVAAGISMKDSSIASRKQTWYLPTAASGTSTLKVQDASSGPV